VQAALLGLLSNSVVHGGGGAGGGGGRADEAGEGTSRGPVCTKVHLEVGSKNIIRGAAAGTVRGMGYIFKKLTTSPHPKPFWGNDMNTGVNRNYKKIIGQRL
jgi:hypothetical protein